MKKPLRYLYITLLLQVCIICTKAEAKPMRITLSSAIKEHKVVMTAVSTSQAYNSKGIRLTVENKTSDNLLLEIDPAIILQPEDTQQQNLVLLGQELLAVNSGKSRVVEMQTYCGESDDRAPVNNHPYRFLTTGDSTMVHVLQFIKTNNVAADMAQHAIWVLTNKHSLSDVYDYNNPELSRRLVAYMGQLLGVAVPQYFTVKEINAMQGEYARPQKTLKLVAHLQWTLSSPEKLSLNIYNDQNERIATYFTDKEFIKGRYDLNASFETADYPAGAYTIRLITTAQQVLKEISVQLE